MEGLDPMLIQENEDKIDEYIYRFDREWDLLDLKMYIQNRHNNQRRKKLKEKGKKLERKARKAARKAAVQVEQLAEAKMRRWLARHGQLDDYIALEAGESSVDDGESTTRSEHPSFPETSHASGLWDSPHGTNHPINLAFESQYSFSISSSSRRRRASSVSDLSNYTGYDPSEPSVITASFKQNLVGPINYGVGYDDNTQAKSSSRSSSIRPPLPPRPSPDIMYPNYTLEDTRENLPRFYLGYIDGEWDKLSPDSRYTSPSRALVTYPLTPGYVTEDPDYDNDDEPYDDALSHRSELSVFSYSESVELYENALSYRFEVSDFQSDGGDQIHEDAEEDAGRKPVGGWFSNLRKRFPLKVHTQAIARF